MSKRKSQAAVKIHTEKLIRQLGTVDGFFNEELGKSRAKELVKTLWRANDVVLTTEGLGEEFTHPSGTKDVAMKDHAVRASISKEFSDSEEAVKLCKVSLMNKQVKLLDILTDQMDRKIYGKTKPTPTKRSPKKAWAGKSSSGANRIVIPTETTMVELAKNADTVSEVIEQATAAPMIPMRDVDAAISRTYVAENFIECRELSVEEMAEMIKSDQDQLSPSITLGEGVNSVTYYPNSTGDGFVKCSKSTYESAYYCASGITVAITGRPSK